MGKSEREALLSAAGDYSEHDKTSTASSFYYSQQTPSLLSESLLHPQHSIREELDDNERVSDFSSNNLNSDEENND